MNVVHIWWEIFFKLIWRNTYGWTKIFKQHYKKWIATKTLWWKNVEINVDEHYTFLWKQNISLPYQISDTSNIYLIIHTTKKKEKSIRVFDKLFQKSLFAFQRSKKIHFNTCSKHMQNLVFLDKHLKFSNKHLMKFYSIALFQNHMTLFFYRGLKVAWARIGRTNFTIAASEWEKHLCLCHAFSLQLLRSIVY